MKLVSFPPLFPTRQGADVQIMKTELDPSRLSHLAEIREDRNAGVRRIAGQIRNDREALSRLEAEIAELATLPRRTGELDKRHAELRDEADKIRFGLDEMTARREELSAAYRQATRLHATCLDFAKVAGLTIPRGAIRG